MHEYIRPEVNVIVGPLSKVTQIYAFKHIPKLLVTSKSNFMWSLYGQGRRKFVQMMGVTWPRWLPCLYVVKPLKIFVSYIYTLFLYHFCSLFEKFWIESCKISGKEKLINDMFGYRVKQLSPWHDVNQTLCQPINYFIYLSLTCNVTWTTVIHRCMNLVGLK